MLALIRRIEVEGTRQMAQPFIRLSSLKQGLVLMDTIRECFQEVSKGRIGLLDAI